MTGTSNFAEATDRILREHRALAILRALLRISAYRANERVLSDIIDLLALGCSREQLRSDLDALERLSLLGTHLAEAVLIITLTERGREVAEGRVMVDGVLRPRPDERY